MKTAIRLPLQSAFIAALLAAGIATAVAQIAVPPLTARVTDLTGTLTPEQTAALEAKLRAFEERKGSQLAVLIVPTTDPEDIAGFGIRVAEAWKLGRKGVDDGAILIVAKNDRRLRIEVGYGLEGPLPDAIARRIIADTITPHFKQGDFYNGIDAGLDQMMRVVDGEPLPEPDRRWSPPGGVDWIAVALVLIVIGGGVLRVLLGRMGGALATGGISGVLAYFITHVLPIAGLVGLAGFVLALLFGGFGGPRGWVSRGRHGGFSGWTGGGLGGGGFSGGGGGGFSGGGGGFGGGGASGSW